MPVQGQPPTTAAPPTAPQTAAAVAICAAFGDKHALFSLAVKRYIENRAQYATKAREEPTLEKVVRALFDKTVAFLTAPGHPPTV